jgi:DNA-directed RNA polymerase specialized sigma24 family protein
MDTDAELLRRYTDTGSQEAFAELVQRHLTFVYAAALRQVGGSAHRAEDVTQAVFVALARKADSLARRPELVGWLYTSTHFAAAKLKRAEQRRQTHEQGSGIYDQVLDAFSNTLGPDRNTAFLTLEADQLEKVLGHFGGEIKTVTIGRNTQPGDQNQYLVTDRSLYRLKDAHGETNDDSWSTTDYRDRAAVVDRFGALTQLLPPDF